MKIFIGTLEICGWINLYAKEFKKLGHTVTTFTFSKNRYFTDNKYDYVFSDYIINYSGRFKWLNKFISKLNKIIKSLFLNSLMIRISKKCDVVIYIWNSLIETNSDIKYFKERGLKIIFLFVGSDVRHFKTFSNQFDVSLWTFPSYITDKSQNEYLKYILNAENYGNLIYSVPDQAGLQSKPYFHLQIPIEIDRISFKNNNRLIPKVLHLPSDPWKKGTDIIVSTINELLLEGVKIEFITFRDISNKKTLEVLQDIDIVVDEIVFHGPGVLAFEAMASGCAVATRYLSNSPSCFRPPILNIDRYTIKEQLRLLFTDYNLQQELIINGRKYVEENNNSLNVAQSIVNNLKNPKPYDYYPLISKSA